MTAITLLLITAFAAVVGGLLVTTNATNATETNTTTADTTTLATTNVGNYTTAFPFGGPGSMMIGEQQFGGPRCGGRGGPGNMGGYGNIEVSSEYTANVNAIIGNDTDVQNLISQGYNVTSIHPILKNIIESDGTLVTKATTAIVLMENGTSGYATVNVDVSAAKVTQIIIITRTVIDKTSS